MQTITATYSPEDNKIRLYASSRLDADTYARVKAAGFGWAPKQDLFVAPSWSPAREDLAIELAGEIEAEQSTMAERAEAKAARLEGLADKNRAKANAFNRAAHQLSERFADGQPILVGHHSERRARKDHERATGAQRNAIKAEKAVGYWLYKASSAQHHANHKNKDSVRARRIKTLLADLRDHQRTLNDAALAVEILQGLSFEKLKNPDLAARIVGGRVGNVSLFGHDAYDEVCRKETKTIEQARDEAVACHTRTLGSAGLARWIGHTLNRLSYERELLGEVAPFVGTITTVMVQEFVREHGAAKPVCKAAGGVLTVTCDAPLPSHIGDGKALSLTADEWRALMQDCGYEATAKAESKAARSSATLPLLNIKPEDGPLFRKSLYSRDGSVDTFKIVSVTKAEFKKMSGGFSDTTFVVHSACGQFRFRVGVDPAATGAFFSRPRVALFISDSKAHKKPVAGAAQ